MMKIRRWSTVALVCALALGACSSGADKPSATGATGPSGSGTAAPSGTAAGGGAAGNDVALAVKGPVQGGHYGVPYNTTPPDILKAANYAEEEFFVTGDADSYAAKGALGGDGVWPTAPNGTAKFTTRVLVRRPTDPAKFNGTVIVEWLNVSAGRDADSDFGFLYPELMQSGYAYVGVSAQSTGVEGGGPALQIPGVPDVSLMPLKKWDPERYGSLSHPGDEYSYGIFTKVGQYFKGSGASGLLGGAKPQHLIAAGESQSAGRMVTYVNAVAPIAGPYDGYLIHSRFQSGAALAAGVELPKTTTIRTDLKVPVFQFETETDVIRGFAPARQPDTDHIVTWEVAGTAHADQSTLDWGVSSAGVWYSGAGTDFEQLCGGPLNTGQQSDVLRAAVDALRGWVTKGTKPPASPQLEINQGAYVVDDLGIARGGIRTPSVDAPISVQAGTPREGASVFCSLFGHRDDFTKSQLATLYSSHDDYVDKVTKSADAAVKARYLLPADRDAMVDKSKSANVP